MADYFVFRSIEIKSTTSKKTCVKFLNQPKNLILLSLKNSDTILNLKLFSMKYWTYLMTRYDHLVNTNNKVNNNIQAFLTAMNPP